MKAIKVFSSGVGYLKDHFLKIIRKYIPDLKEEFDIKWVFTVPATWSDSSKLFLREAAEKVPLCTLLHVLNNINIKFVTDSRRKYVVLLKLHGMPFIDFNKPINFRRQ